MKKIITLIILAFVVLCIAEDNLPTKEEVIENYIEAIGGRNNIEK